MSDKITASIVLYKTDPSELIHVYQCFLKSTIDFQLKLIDNSPTDDLCNVLKDEKVSYHFQNKNVGFGSGHNIALREILATSEFHLVLNSDTSFEPNVLESLVAYLEQHSDVGLVMPKVIYPDGSIQYLCKLIPTPLDLIFRRFLPAFMLQERKEKFQLQFTGYDKTMRVPYLSGCFMLLRTSALKQVGLFDERFFMYPEDIDLTRRINEKYKTIYYPEVSIRHNHAKASYQNGNLFLIHTFNMIKYFNKWGWIFDSKRRKTNRSILKELKYP